jgi:hypothetical protein
MTAFLITEIARSDRQWTRVAVTREDRRIFVSFPRWSDAVPISVAEVLRSGEMWHYPNAAWNDWTTPIGRGRLSSACRVFIATAKACCGFSSWKPEVRGRCQRGSKADSDQPKGR